MNVYFGSDLGQFLNRSRNSIYNIPLTCSTGGSAALASAYILGPRIGRYSNGTDPLPMGSPVNACMVSN